MKEEIASRVRLPTSNEATLPLREGRKIGARSAEIFRGGAVGGLPEICSLRVQISTLPRGEGCTRSHADSQNLIFARESSDTALVPFWPAKFIW